MAKMKTCPESFARTYAEKEMNRWNNTYCKDQLTFEGYLSINTHNIHTSSEFSANLNSCNATATASLDMLCSPLAAKCERLFECLLNGIKTNENCSEAYAKEYKRFIMFIYGYAYVASADVLVEMNSWPMIYSKLLNIPPINTIFTEK